LKPPLISICLPTLNSERFLAERLDTICAQTFTDWELVAADSYSNDGTWERLLAFAEEHRKARLFQIPKEGTFPAFNFCVNQARGEYVYIATSDDTMAPDCLEKLSHALNTHPDCDLAHCRLQAEGDLAEWVNSFWQERSLFARSSRSLMDCLHIRLAPFDGLLHLYGETVYISLTQILIRRSLFERIGLFESKWGGIGDFHWVMRASLVANTIHVPHTWGGWRLHPAQVTAQAGLWTDEHRQKIEEMIVDALSRSEQAVSEQVLSHLRRGWRARFRSRSDLLRELERLRNGREFYHYLLRQMVKLSGAAWAFILANLGLYKSHEENFLIPISEWMINGNTRRSSYCAVQDACGAWFLRWPSKGQGSVPKNFLYSLKRIYRLVRQLREPISLNKSR
jgi:glycosyltransferase involved in cell wall biosynthesis